MDKCPNTLEACPPPERRRTCLIFLLSLILLSSPSHADTSLTMHGVAKLTTTATHYPYTNPDAPKGGVLKQAEIGTFNTLNPFTLKGKPPRALGPGPSLVFDRLTDRSWDEPFTLYPLIAKSWDVPPDRSSITFHIDPRAQFHDHTPITADDVKFTYETLRDLGRPNMRRVYKLVADATIIDPHTIKFTLKPDHDRETVMIVAMLPVLSRASFTNRPFDAATFDPILGSGPYRIADADPGHRVIFERVPDYWAADLPTRKGQYNFDQVIYDFYRDDMVAFESFKSGNLNFRRENDVTLWATGYDFPGKRAGRVVTFENPHGRAEMVRTFIPNTRRVPFNDIAVRRALSNVFDFDWVNKNLYASMLNRTTSVFPNTDLSRTAPTLEGPVPLRTRLQQADTLLKSSGWVIKNSIRVNAKTGIPFRFEILLSSAGDEKIALSFARTLKKLGITARTRTLDTAAFRDRINTYDFDMIFYGWSSTLSPGGEQALYWGCKAASEPGRFNYAGICDPEIDSLTAKIGETFDRAALIAATQRLDSKIMDPAYLIPFGYLPVDLIGLSRDIGRPAVTPLYGVVPESWWSNAPTP